MNQFPTAGPGVAGRGPWPFGQAPQTSQIIPIIYAKLQEQGPAQGWQTQLQTSNRAGSIMGL